MTAHYIFDNEGWLAGSAESAVARSTDVAPPTFDPVFELPNWSGLAWIVRAKPVPPAPPTREQLKAQREAAVAAIKVTTAAGTWDGDEVSQGRLARAADTLKYLSAQKQAGTPLDLTPFGPCYQLVGDEYRCVWVLANNTPIYASENELREALALAGATQAAIWVLP